MARVAKSQGWNRKKQTEGWNVGWSESRKTGIGRRQGCRRWDRNKAKESLSPWLSQQVHLSHRSLLDPGPSALGQKGKGQGFRA